MIPLKIKYLTGDGSFVFRSDKGRQRDGSFVFYIYSSFVSYSQRSPLQSKTPQSLDITGFPGNKKERQTGFEPAVSTLAMHLLRYKALASLYHASQ